MRHSKLYSILETFNKYEQNRLRKFLTSPYFNRNERIVTLFEMLVADVNRAAEKRKPDLTKEELWAGLHPDKEYDDVRFRKYCSDLLKLVESYLAQEEFGRNPLLKATLLIEAVGNRKIEKLYRTVMRTANRYAENYPYRSALYYYYQYQKEKNFYDLNEAELKRAEKSNMEEIANNLDRFFLAEKLRIYCAVLNQQKLVSVEYDLLFIDEIIRHLEQHLEGKYADVPPVALYYQIYLATRFPDEVAHYHKLKELLDAHIDAFPKKEALTIYYSAVNYCIQKVIHGKAEFQRELFELYRTMLHKEILLANGELSPWDFKNIVLVGLRMQEYDWTERFIMQYQHYLPEQFRRNAVTYNLATLYFRKKEYEKVVELLREVEYEEFSYNLNSKVLLMATYYEIDEFDPLHFLMESFRTYLTRHKEIPADRRRIFHNFIRYTRKLTRIIPGDQKAIERVRKELEADSEVVNKDWLLEKLEELK